VRWVWLNSISQREREREREREDSLDPYLNMAVVGGGGDRRFLTDVEG
jgi:hypothetical protein